MCRTFYASIVMTIAMVGTVAPSAQAQCIPNAGPFCIDGVITPANNSGAAQPALFTSDPTGAKEFGPLNGANTKVGTINFATPPPTILGDTTMPAKVDLTGVYTQSALSGTDFWYYYAWTRATTTGSGFMAVEFQRAAKPTVCSLNYNPLNATALQGCNPWANRDGDGTPENSDFMILWDQTGNSFAVQNIFVRFYNKALGAFGPAQNLTLAGSAVAVYGGNGSDPSKGEMALNFSVIVGGGISQCLTFANIIPNTVTGNSDSADYKDTVLSNFPVASSCGTVTVQKITVPATSGIQFQYTMADGTPMFGVAQPDADCDGTGSSINQCIGSVAHNETDTITDLLQSSNYTLIESDKPSNYGLTSIICTPAGGNPVDVTAGGTFPVTATKTTACVITNTLQTANLNIIKVVNNNFGSTKGPGDFSFTRDSGAAEPFANGGVSCVSGAICKTISYPVGTSFVVDEPSVPIGYTLVSKAGCSGVIVASGNTCTITNADAINDGTVYTRMKVILHDRATIGAIRRGTGETASTLTFRLYSDAACTTQVATEAFNITFANATEETKSFATLAGYTVDYNTAVNPALVSNYRWRAFYSGNSFNSAQSTVCGDENISLTAFQN